MECLPDQKAAKAATRMTATKSKASFKALPMVSEPMYWKAVTRRLELGCELVITAAYA